MTPSMSAAGNGGSSSPSNGSDARKRVPSNNNGNAIDCTPPDFLLPGASSNDRPLLPLHPANKEQNRVACLKILTTSAWNSQLQKYSCSFLIRIMVSLPVYFVFFQY